MKRKADAANAIAAAPRTMPASRYYVTQVSAMVAILHHGSDDDARAALKFRKDIPLDPWSARALEEAIEARGLTL